MCIISSEVLGPHTYSHQLFPVTYFPPRANLFFTLSSVKCKTCFSWICALNSWMTRWLPCWHSDACSLDVFPPLLDSSALQFTSRSADTADLCSLIHRLRHALHLTTLSWVSSLPPSFLCSYFYPFSWDYLISYKSGVLGYSFPSCSPTFSLAVMLTRQVNLLQY